MNQKSNAGPLSKSDGSNNLRAEYGEVAQTFRLLTDIRFKLLGLLPVGTGAAVGVVLNNKPPEGAGLIGVFGLAVTVALFTYNARNDQHYGELAGRAAHLERLMGIKEGAFGHRPGRWLEVFYRRVEHGWPVTLVYGVSMAAWLYLALLPQLSIEPDAARHGAAALIAGFMVLLALDHWDKRQSYRQRKMRLAANGAVRAATNLTIEELRDYTDRLSHICAVT